MNLVCMGRCSGPPKESHTRTPSSCARCRWGKIGQWNIAGQKVDLLDVAAKDHDLLFVQEISRDRVGWDQYDRDEFHWIVHQGDSQWRGVGIGIAKDKFDSVIHKKATQRGVWVVARVVGLGRLILGSLHAHTGVTNGVYQAAVHEFMATCPKKYRHLPLLCGVDANEVPKWRVDESRCHGIAESSSNLSALLHDCRQQGIEPVVPEAGFYHAWTHFPRDETRNGRQIDMLLRRQVHVTLFVVDADRRHCIGSDHALLSSDLWIAGRPAGNRWRNDSRARWVTTSLPGLTLVDEVDITELAQTCSKPRFSQAYRDDDEVREAIAAARGSNLTRDWKKVHRLRQRKRKAWCKQRLSSILAGDWEQYRLLQAEKKRSRGWWGNMLEERSAAQLATEIHDHLAAKMQDQKRSAEQWDEELNNIIAGCTAEGDFTLFELHEVWEELQQMRCRSAVGPDKIGVHLLRCIAQHDDLGPQLIELINHIISNLELPASWSHSFLALLAKVPNPLKPSDLRPICVSSAFNKLVSRLVCRRILPALRVGSKISCCGKGRQAADLVGGVTRIRDVAHEWKLPLLLCKLDVAGAFDRVKRDRVAAYLVENLKGRHLNVELKYMLAQLRSHTMHGNAPGGVEVELVSNIGIKQGAPESAEIFGLLIDALLSRLVHCRQWGEIGTGFDDLDIDLLFYQDDIFIVESNLGRLCRKISAVNNCLASAGLCLAKDKTKIVANEHYTGARRAKMGEDVFVVAGRGDPLKVLGLNFSLSRQPSEQAQEVISRTREAVAAHSDILNASGAWFHKVKVMRSLVESQLAWIAGALFWSRDDLHALNVLQAHALRSAFHLHRKADETWVDWNTRSIRLVRVWLHANKVTRWSTRVLQLQHMLHGHWARRTEVVQGNPMPCLTMKALMWRNTNWWREQQKLSPTVSLRHPGRFYASNTERQLATCHGNLWFVAAQNRSEWVNARNSYVQEWDVKWASGRQLSIRY